MGFLIVTSLNVPFKASLNSLLSNFLNSVTNSYFCLFIFKLFEIDDEGDERKGVNWDVVNQTVEIYLNNELNNKDIKHNLLTNLIICVNMQKEISKAEYLAGR